MSKPDTKHPLYLKKQKKSLFNTDFEYKEYPDIPLLLGFLENKMGIKLRKKVAEYYTDEQTHYSSYIKNLVFDINSQYGGYIPVSYFLSKTGWGRIQAYKSLSMNTFHRPTRHSFAKKNYIDFDMVNCQIQLFYELAKKANLSTAGLKEYCADSKAMRRSIASHYKLQDIINEDGVILTAYEQAKKLPIRLAFGGTLHQWKVDYNVGDMPDSRIVLELEMTIETLCNKVCEVNPHIYSDLLKYSSEWKEKDENERQRSLLGNYAQTWERVIQETCIAYLIRNYTNVNIQDIISCQDGFMVLKEQLQGINIDNLLDQFKKEIFRKFDILMTWEIKPFDEAIDIMPSSNPTETNHILVEMKLKEEELRNQSIDFDIQIPQAYDYSIAEDFYNKFCFAKEEQNKIKQNQIIVSSGKSSNQEWFYFENHKWNYSNDNSFCREKLSNDYLEPISKQYSLIKDRISILSNQIIGDKSTKDADQILKDEIKLLEQKLNPIQKIIDKCLSSSGKSNIIKELYDKCKIDKFTEKLDLNPYLLCCANGVIDIENKIFRDGKPSDMCSLSTNINYIESHNESIETDVMDFFNKVFPFESQREYMLNHLASSLIGVNKNQVMNYYIGGGSNGKSILIELMSQVMGDYKTSVPLSLITQKRQVIGGTSSEIANLRGTRYAVIQEPSIGDTINEGIFKELTGGDPLTARGIYREPITFKPMFNLVVCANVFLSVKSNDNGTWRRIKVVEFSSKFIDNPDCVSNEDFVFLKDSKLLEKMKGWVEYVLYLLVQYAFLNQGVIGAFEMVDNATEKYRLSQDRVGQFIKNSLLFNRGDKVTKEKLSYEFKHWFELNFKYSIKSKDLFDRLENEYGLSSNCTQFFGIRLKDSLTEEVVVSNEEIFKEAFIKEFELTNNLKSDFIKCSTIQEWAKTKGLSINTSKQINPVLKELGLDMMDKQRYRDKKIDGVCYHCWWGLKRRVVVETLTDNEVDTEED